jgi:hypothetical protein
MQTTNHNINYFSDLNKPVMKKLAKILMISVLAFTPVALNAQVLITILLGDALNTDKIEFGLVGGFNRSNIPTISDAKAMNNFDLGFYFHILMKGNSYLSTGVLVKTNVGATGMDTYPLGDPSFDTVYKDGTLKKKINCFSVPILYHYRFHNRWYLEAGPQLALIFKPSDNFEESALDGDLTFKKVVKDEYKHIDAGLMVGGGYKLKKQVKSLSIGMSYYYGLVDVSKTDVKIKNSAVYFFVRIPIGTGGDKKTEQPK